MNSLKSVCLSWLLLALATPAPAAERYRTDINPALIYYQAFALTPDLSPSDHRYLFETEWRGRTLEPRAEELIAKYGNYFKMVQRAAHSQVPCDWGIDLTQGPDTLLPGLAKAKAVANTARLRVQWHLQHGRQAEARDELLAAFALARNVSKDGVLISALVQIAMENILASIVAENFFQFSPETLVQLVAGFDAVPPRGTLQQCMAAEKGSFYDWYAAKVREFQAETPSDDAQVLANVRALFARTLNEGASNEGAANTDLVENVIAYSGGTSAGLLARLKEIEPLFAEMTAFLGRPYAQYASAAKAFDEKIRQHPNPLVSQLFPAVAKARAKEFPILVKLAMIRAAVEYRLHGQAGFEQVTDPCGSGPFRLERLEVAPSDRGFVVKSKLNLRGFDEVLVFADPSGPPVQVDGKNAGKPLPKATIRR